MSAGREWGELSEQDGRKAGRMRLEKVWWAHLTAARFLVLVVTTVLSCSTCLCSLPFAICVLWFVLARPRIAVKSACTLILCASCVALMRLANNTLWHLAAAISPVKRSMACESYEGTAGGNVERPTTGGGAKRRAKGRSGEGERGGRNLERCL